MFFFPRLPGAHPLHSLLGFVDRLSYFKLLLCLVFETANGARQKICIVENFLPYELNLMTLCKPRIFNAPQKSVVHESPVVNNDIASLDEKNCLNQIVLFLEQRELEPI